MKVKKKLILSSLVLFLAINFNIVKVDAIELDEDFDYTICHSDLSNADEDTKNSCRLYQEKKNEEANEINSKIDDIRAQQEENKANIEKGMAKINEYNTEISKIEKEIEALEEEIKIAESNISTLLEEIETREAKIAEIDSNIKERMVALQSFMHINNYIDFLVGASSFMDLIRRVEALNDIQKYDNDLMNQLNEELTELNKDKEELNRQLSVLEDDKANVEKQRDYITSLKTATEELMVEYYKKEAELEAEEAELLDDLDEVNEAFNQASAALGEFIGSTGWTKPIKGAYVSASTWYYPKSFGGGIHLGIDLAADVGTDVKAAANGYILYSVNKWDTYGYLGCKDGKPGSTGGGNQCYLVCSVNGKTYVVKYLHLKKNSVVEMGTVVSAGDKIAEVGSSGNSTGPHCHVEIIYLGKKSISYYVSHWDGDFSFGCGWNTEGIRNTCKNTGGSAPCRLAPADTLGY